MALPLVRPARPPALPDHVIRNMAQVGHDFVHSTADAALIEYVMFSFEEIAEELLRWRALGAQMALSLPSNVIPLPGVR